MSDKVLEDFSRSHKLPNRTAKPAAASSDSFSAHTSTKLEMLGAGSHYFSDMGECHQHPPHQHPPHPWHRAAPHRVGNGHEGKVMLDALLGVAGSCSGVEGVRLRSGSCSGSTENVQLSPWISMNQSISTPPS